MAQIPICPVGSGYCSFWLLLSIRPHYQQTRHCASLKNSWHGADKKVPTTDLNLRSQLKSGWRRLPDKRPMPTDSRIITPALPGPTSDLLAKLEGIYRDIHANPELSMQEHRTSGIAAAWLREQGYDVTEGVGGTGVVGLLRNGDAPVVLLRADMDALPIKESTGLPYASQATGTDRFDQAT